MIRFINATDADANDAVPEPSASGAIGRTISQIRADRFQRNPPPSVKVRLGCRAASQKNERPQR